MPRQANALLPGWGQIIFQSANEIAANKVLRDRLEEIEAQLEHDKEWWDKRRGDVKTAPKEEEQQQPADDGASEKGQTKAGSEDEPVLVESADTPSAAATPAATPPATPQGGKKKKGRK